MNGRATHGWGSTTHRRWFWLGGGALAAVALSCVGAAIAGPSHSHHVHLPKHVALPPPAPKQFQPPSPPKQVSPPHHTKHDGPGHHAKHSGPPHQSKHDGPPHHAKHDGPSHHAKHDGPSHHSKHDGPSHHSKHDGPSHHAKHDGPSHHAKHDGPSHHSKHDGPSHHAKHDGPSHHAKHDGPSHHGKHDGHHGKHDGHHGKHGKHDQNSKKAQPVAAPSQPQAAPKQAAAQPKATSSQPIQIVAPIVTPGPAPPPQQQPAAASDARPPENAGEAPATRAEFEPPMRIGAPLPDRDPDGRPGKSDEKAKKGGADAASAVKSWASRLPPPEGTYKAQEVLGFKLTPAARERLRQLGYTPQPSTASGITQIILPAGLDPWTAQRRLEAEFQQGFALNFLYDHYRNVLDSAPITGLVPVSGSEGCTTERCYGRKVIGWNDQIGACAKGVKIGVIDTGYDAGHPAFANLKATVVMEDEASRSPDWHGTGVLSLLGGAAKSSTPGLVPEAEFLIADAFYKTTFGRARTDTARLLEALRRLEQRGAQVINMSLVGPSDELVHAQIADMSARKGVVFVAAAGNGGPAAPPGYPAAYKEVIAVTAIDDKKRSYDYANRGSYIDVAAPGVRIWTAQPSNMEGMLNGTSFAAPFVTGIAAAIYNSTPLRAQLREGGLPLDPKGAVLAAFNIEKLGNGDRNDQYGLGLVKAPASCAPAAAPPVAGVRKPPPPAAATTTQSWQGDIKRAAYQ
jgi:subtilisin family serine protease